MTAIHDWWLAESDRRDRELQARLNAWREGWDACQSLLDDTYEEGFTDGLMALKRAEHQAHKLVQGDTERWGPGGRERFADPRPGDYAGGPVPAW